MMRRGVLLGALCLAGLAPALAFSQPGGGPMRGTATRSVSLYLERERALAAALDQRNRAAVEALLADGFTARSSAGPDVLERDAWLLSALGGRKRESRVRDLSVTEDGDVAVVSFLLDMGQGRGATTQFVVDVWKSSAGRLLTRHVAAGARTPPPPPRPNGRE
ncbi:nuclear transport factor 2 family protein [Roseateles saccharophilus]|uniref:Uncharacterized protein DUF4440 n=2 Tax=Roseateles saccharophilus TaxID=304 RepID=A0A4V2VS67_ROSSA|nr:nuclear transport factor 2 family protein [Roseateles saccharophilus]TCV01240.1 uncharacterized protein DUF4440 [Roseateles saccharophilus]